jgi:hypothetical protein
MPMMPCMQKIHVLISSRKSVGLMISDGSSQCTCSVAFFSKSTSSGIFFHVDKLKSANYMRQGSMVSQWLLPTRLHEHEMINRFFQIPWHHGM